MSSNEGRCKVMEKYCENKIVACDRDKVVLDSEWVELMLAAKSMGLEIDEIRGFLTESKTVSSS